MNNIIPPIAPEGYIFIIIFAIITLILFIISSTLGVIGLGLTIWCALFFRDPARVTPQRDSLVVAPADGKIIIVERVTPPEDLGLQGERLKISIFMNVFNVHINRAPCSGIINRIIYYPGKFFNASLDKSSEHNEKQAFIMSTRNGEEVAFVQIAGLIARRIVKFIDEDTEVRAGEKIGLIRFGSRLDIYLPDYITPAVSVGQTAIAGETILADFDYNGGELNYDTLDRAQS